MTGRRRRTASIAVISWRDIPAQVVAIRGDDRETAVLSERFQHAIDRAAGVAGATDTAGYVDQWTRDEDDLEEDIATQVAASAAQLEAQYDDELLEQLVQNGGFKRDDDGASQRCSVAKQAT
ncbi:MAG: virulence factor [Acidimicrobiales bacterium]|jgi:cation transport regulator ChaB|nr:virulence factor [Acidimicrobiales bacterium]MDP6901210.1 virulence factor [Acidimicrobiales bacterium]HJM00154.1 virulence factor [Acidimicrobiales bacterium]